MIWFALVVAVGFLLAAIVHDAWRSRRCAWCGLTRPTLRHYFDTHHQEHRDV